METQNYIFVELKIDIECKITLNQFLFLLFRYNAIIKYKTAYYTFQLPVAVAMNLAKMFNEEQHRQAKTILMEIGEFYQIQVSNFTLVHNSL